MFFAEIDLDDVVKNEIIATKIVPQVLRAVENGQYNTQFEQDVTYGEMLESFIEKGYLTDIEVELAFQRGVKNRIPTVLRAVREGRIYERSGLKTTFEQEFDELVASGYIDEDEAYIAELKGKRHCLDMVVLGTIFKRVRKIHYDKEIGPSETFIYLKPCD